MSAIDFVSGCVGGAAGVLVGHPFDTVKVIMQTNSTPLSIMSVLKQSSLPSLYKGIKAPLTGLAGINAIVFGVHGTIMKLAPLAAAGDDGATGATAAQPLSRAQAYTWCGLAGAFAGFVQSVITGPMELVKTRSQLTQRPVGECLRRIVATEGGPRALFRGLGVTVARDTPGLATYFVTYEMLMDYLRERAEAARQQELLKRRRRKTANNFTESIEPKENTSEVAPPPPPPPPPPLLVSPYPSTLAVLFAGGTAGMLSWLIVYPLDVIKSRLQADARFASSRQVVLETYRTEGLAVFMRGCSPTLLRAFPTNAATFAVVTWTLYSYEMYCNRQALGATSAAAAAAAAVTLANGGEILD